MMSAIQPHDVRYWELSGDNTGAAHKALFAHLLILERQPLVIRYLIRGYVMLEVKDVLPNGDNGDLLSPEQATIGLSLRRYYQLHPLEPTPARLRMLMVEFARRVETTR